MKKPFTALAAIALAISTHLSPAFAEEITLKQNNINLRGNLNLAEGKTIKDGVVVLLHGTFAHNKMEIIQTIADLLHEKGYNTLAINLSYNIDNRPSTMLDCSITHTHKHEDAITELDTWMKWLNEQGTTKIALLGHSRGGNQAVWYGTEHDTPALEKIIAIAPATWNATTTATEYETRYKQPLAPLLSTAEKNITDTKADTILDTAGLVYCEKAKASAASIASYYKDDPRKNTPTLLSKIKKPLLIAMGSADEVVKDLPEQLKTIKQDNLQITTIEGADHFFLDLYADELVDKTTDFIDWH